MTPQQKLDRARELARQEITDGHHSVAELEHEADLHVNTLRRFIEAMGGRLDIVAHFPDGDVRITKFEVAS